MAKLDINTLMQKTISELAAEHHWSKQGTDTMVCLIHDRERIAKTRHNEKKSDKLRELTELKEKTTLKELIKFLEAKYFEIHPANNNNNCGFSFFRERYRTWLNWFVDLGLTRADSIILPQRTVTLDILKALPKNELLEKDTRILGTLTHKALEPYCFTNQKDRWKPNLPYPTIREFLATPPMVSTDALIATRNLLEQLGFNYEDGIFMQEYTLQGLIDNLVTEEQITTWQAALVADIAFRRGWIKLFQGRDRTLFMDERYYAAKSYLNQKG